MGNSLLNSLSGLLAAERAIATTSHNIANANTEGYSRQSVTQVARVAQQSGSLLDGAGVQTQAVQRIHNDYLETRLQSVTSEYSRIETISQLSNRVNTLFVEENSGLNSAQVAFFNALEDAANNPHAQAPAEHVIATADELVSRFNFVDSELNDLQSQVNFSIQSELTEINELSANIHALNQQIARVSSSASNNPPSDLLDERDALLQELSGYVNITALPRNSLGIDVIMDNGVSLVTLAGAASLQTISNPADPDKLSFVINNTNGSRTVSEPTGGSLGGLLEFGRDVLDNTRSELGQLAAVMAHAVNDLYEEIDPANANNPVARAEFFTQDLNSPVANSNNQGAASVAIEMVDPGAISSSSYVMTYDGSGYTITRLSDYAQVSGGTSLTMDGIEFNVSGAAVAGDSFTIKPFVGVAKDIDVKPVEATDLGTMVGSSTQQYIPVSQTIADLRSTAIFNNGAASLSEQYATLVAGVGSATKTADVQLQSMSSILEDARNRHDQLSGVSLDEEAANLIKYQQAYEASARVMVVSGTMFDTLLAAIN